MQGDKEYMQLSMLNEYLNGYAEMLAASTCHDRTTIAIDLGSFSQTSRMMETGMGDLYRNLN